MEVENKPRLLRLVHGTVQEVEDWLAAHVDSYVATNFVWSVIDNRQMVTAQCVAKSEVEKAIRMQQFAANAMQGPPRRM